MLVASVTGGEPDHLLQAAELGHEERDAVGERVLDQDAGAEDDRRQAQRRRRHRSAGLRQHGVEADRAQQRALARHVRAGDQQHGGGRTYGDVVGDPPVVGDQRMRQRRGHVRGRSGVDAWERPARLVVRQRGECGERFPLAQSGEPLAHVAAAAPLPALHRQLHVHVPEGERGHHRVDGRAPQIGELGEPVQARELARRVGAARQQACAQRVEARLVERGGGQESEGARVDQQLPLAGGHLVEEGVDAARQRVSEGEVGDQQQHPEPPRQVGGGGGAREQRHQRGEQPRAPHEAAL
jgi:hypothetical protein